MFQLDSDIYDKNRKMQLSERLGAQQLAAGQQDMAVNDDKLKQQRMERAVQYLGMATPQNWQAVRQQAITEGLGDESMIPPAYDENWIQQTKAAFSSASAQLPTSAIQNYKFSELLSGDPAKKAQFDEFARSSKIMDAGGQIVQINPFTGQSKPVQDKSVPPEQTPEIKGQQAVETAKGKTVGESMGNMEKKTIAAPEMENLLNKAEELLPGATSGGLASMGKGIAGFFGSATDGSKIDTQLNVIAAALTGNVPRFEGPQGVLDVELYKQAAGDLANTSLPVETRLAAIKTMRDLNNKYLNIGTTSPAPTTPAAATDGWSVEEVQ